MEDSFMEKEANEKTTEAPAPAKSVFPIKWIIVGILALVIIGGGAFVALRYFSASGSSSPKENTAAKAEKSEKEAQVGMMYSMEPFIVNLLDKGGKRYLKVKMELEVPGEKVSKELAIRKAQLRDTVLLLLTSKKFEDVNRLDGKFQLRNELIFRINQVLRTGKVQALYFTEFVVQ
jgi:flagellar FliL protein